MNVVGLMSTYKEGELARAAIESILAVTLDGLYIYEGPAGEPLDDEIPDTAINGLEYFGVVEPRAHAMRSKLFVVERGRWRTDARKRDAMLQRAKKDFPSGPLWGVILDGDEILVNGAYLRDRLQAILWDDEAKGASIATPENTPTVRWPLRLIEGDGAISFITARVVRLDLIRSIDISSSVITNISGVQEGWGNVQELSRMWLEMWLGAVDKGAMVAWPPLPCEPCIVHRSHLRHPARRRLRMSVQETAELAREKKARGLA